MDHEKQGSRRLRAKIWILFMAGFFGFEIFLNTRSSVPTSVRRAEIAWESIKSKAQEVVQEPLLSGKKSPSSWEQDGEIETYVYVTPDSPDWPSDEVWEAELGNLLSPRAELYNNMDVSYNEKCEIGEIGYSFMEEHGGVCSIFRDCRYRFCNRDGRKVSAIPPYSVKVIEPSDITKALDFANRYNIQVSVKLTGHNFAGQSYTKDSLNIWVIHLETHGSVYEDFQDTCGINHTVVGIGGGALNNDVLATIKGDYHIASGDTHSVGFSGWLLGGGLSHTMRGYGMGQDNIKRFDIVLANGTEVIADACTNPDLFWALRGGGGGFGVVTHMYYQLHPPSKVVLINFHLDHPTKDELRAWMHFWTDFTLHADQRVAGGFWHVGHFEIFIMGDKDLANELFLNDLEKFLEEKVSCSHYLRVEEHDSWYDTLGGNRYQRERKKAELQNFGHGPIASARIIPRQMVLDERDRIIELFVEVSMNYELGGYWIGGKVAEVGEDETSGHPALRSALWAMTTTDRWASKIFRDIFNNTVSGCSFNHHSPEEPEWRTALWGDRHYQRLLEIKKKYDPDHRFNCWHCVGYQGEEFSVNDFITALSR